MEYNVLNNIELVKDVISDVVKIRRRFRTRHTISRFVDYIQREFNIRLTDEGWAIYRSEIDDLRDIYFRKDIEGSSMREREKDELLNTIFAKDDLLNIWKLELSFL